MEHAVINYLSQKSEPKSENPDLDFFKSILPDMGNLNASQKRRFKVVVLQTLDNILQEKNTSTSASASLSTNDRQANAVLMYSSDLSASNTAHTSHMYNNIPVGTFTPD